MTTEPIPALTPAEVEVLREAIDDAGDWYKTAQTIRATLGAPPSLGAHALMRALEYRFVLDDEHGGPYAPIMESSQGSYPEPLDEATSATLGAWADAFARLDDIPMVAARLGDLLWLRRHGDSPHQYAQAAQDGLCEVGVGHRLVEIERTDALRRALALARELNDVGRMRKAADLMFSLVDATLDEGADKPGVALSLLQALAGLPSTLRPEGLDARLERATKIYADDPFILSEVLDVRLALLPAGDEAASDLGLQAVRLWEAAADRETGLVRMAHLHRAVERARLHGDADELERLRTKAQQSSESGDLGLQKISATVEIPKDKVVRFLASFTAGDNHKVWLTRFGLNCPVPEDPKQSEDEARAQMKAHPLQFLFTKVIVTADNLPLYFVSNEEDHLRLAIIENETRGIGLWGIFAAKVLRALRDKGPVERSTLAAYLTDGGPIDATLASKFADCFAHHWAGRFDEAALLALPRIESVLRAAARRLDIRTYTEPGSGQRAPVGRHAGLGELLDKMRGRVPEGDRRYLRRFLSDPLSLNLRNDLLHGLSIEPSEQDAALVLHAVCVIALWRFGPASAP